MSASLSPWFSFVYRSELDHGLVEHEYDHVFVGHSDGLPNVNPDEVSEWRWAPTELIRQELNDRPGDFTSWFRICFERAATASATAVTTADRGQSLIQ